MNIRRPLRLLTALIFIMAVFAPAAQPVVTGAAKAQPLLAQLPWSSSSPLVWGSVNWNSVNSNSVSWNSADLISVNWNS